MLYSGIGYFWLMAGMRFRYTITLGGLLVACNFIYEMFIGVLNTPDIIDAYYGVAGTVVAFLFLLICKKFGFKLNPQATPKVQD